MAMPSFKSRDIPSLLNHQFFGFDDAITKMVNVVSREEVKYPPYNVVKLEDDKFLIEIAAAGFQLEDFTITHDRTTLKVEGSNVRESSRNYLFQGIAERKFSKEFAVADTIVVKTASFTDGILSIELENIIPEEKKIKTIQIRSNTPQTLLG